MPAHRLSPQLALAEARARSGRQPQLHASFWGEGLLQGRGAVQMAIRPSRNDYYSTSSSTPCPKLGLPLTTGKWHYILKCQSFICFPPSSVSPQEFSVCESRICKLSDPAPPSTSPAGFSPECNDVKMKFPLTLGASEQTHRSVASPWECHVDIKRANCAVKFYFM